MGKKLLALVGIGAGYYLVRKQLRDNPEGAAAKVVRTVKENPTVQKTTHKVTEKGSEFVRKQGEAITDKVADSIKEGLFGVESTDSKNVSEVATEDANTPTAAPADRQEGPEIKAN